MTNEESTKFKKDLGLQISQIESAIYHLVNINYSSNQRELERGYIEFLETASKNLVQGVKKFKKEFDKDKPPKEKK
jgi:poly(3-hydroxyalkanoate) synthetase